MINECCQMFDLYRVLQIYLLLFKWLNLNVVSQNLGQLFGCTMIQIMLIVRGSILNKSLQTVVHVQEAATNSCHMKYYANDE